MPQTSAASPPAASSALHADVLRSDGRVSSSLDALVRAVGEAKQGIAQVRPPAGEQRTRFEDLLDAAANVRGRPLLYPYVGSGLGAGPLVELADGSVKYDMISGIGVHFFGHSDEELIRAALEGALADTAMQGHLQMNEEAIRFAQTLVEQASRASSLAHAFLCGSGAMANENALKVCFQKHYPADRVIAFEHCFMGRSTTMAQIGDSAAGREGLPVWMHADYMPFYDEAQARQRSAGDVSGSTRVIDNAVRQLETHLARYPGRHACFFFELIQGEGGFNSAPPEFFKALMEACKASNIAVAVDEVQTFGRTTSMFRFEGLGLGEHVDVVTLGKMSQVCAALFTSEYNPKPGLLSGTFLGSSAALRVGLRIMERLRDGGYYGGDGRIARHHRIFREHVQRLASAHSDWFPKAPGVGDIAGGEGGMMRFTPFGGVKQRVLDLCKALFDEGVIAFYCGHGPYHVRFLPPLGVMDEADWPKVFAIVERGMARAAQA